MKLACIHTHTIFCDGHDDVETCCQAAYKKGLLSLGFSAHAPLIKKTGFKTDWHLPDEKLEEYLDSVRAAKKRWDGKLPIYLGLEVDFIKGIMGPADKDYCEMSLDYIIGAVHYLIPPKGAPFTVDDTEENVCKGIEEGFGKDARAMVKAYFRAEEEMISSGGFDLLAHPDLVKKNNGGDRLFSEEEDYYREKTASIADLLGRSGIKAEINTGGLNRGKIKDCYPSREFLKLFYKNKVPMVINADAHRAEDLDGYYEKAIEALLATGYGETLIFNGKKNGEAVWEKIPL